MKDNSQLQPSLREPPVLRWLPLILAIVNTMISLPLIAVELVGATNGWRMGDQLDWPVILLLLVDFPASLVIPQWFDLLCQYCKAYSESTLATAIGGSAVFLVTGFGWYYLVGRGLRWFIRVLRSRQASRRGFPVIPGVKPGREPDGES